MLNRTTLALVALLSVACASTPTPEAPTTTTAVAVDDLVTVKEKLSAGGVLVDVRPAAYAAKNPVQASNIPFDEAEARLADFEALVGGDKTKPVVVACGNGSMALKVRDMLKQNGFTDVSAQAIANVAAPAPAAE